MGQFSYDARLWKIEITVYQLWHNKVHQNKGQINK